MKRDMDLVRLLLIQVEGEEGVDLRNWSEEQVNEHLYMLIKEAGFIEGRITSAFKGGPHPTPERLTWAGHDFLAAIRDETVWKKTRAQLSRVSGFSLDVVKALAIAVLKEELGLA